MRTRFPSSWPRWRRSPAASRTGCASTSRPSRPRRSAADPAAAAGPAAGSRSRAASAPSSTPSSRPATTSAAQMDVALEELADRREARSRRTPRIYNVYGLVYAMLGEDANARAASSSARSSSRRTTPRSATTGAGTCARTAARASRSPSSRSRSAIRCTGRPRSRSSTPASAASRSATSSRAEEYFRRALPIDAEQHPRPRTTSRCSSYRGGRLDESRALMTPRDAAAARRRPRRCTSACASSASSATGRPRSRTCRSCATAIPDSAEAQRHRHRRPANERAATHERPRPDRDAEPTTRTPSAGARACAARARRRAVDRHGRAASEARAAPGAGARGRRLRAAARPHVRPRLHAQLRAADAARSGSDLCGAARRRGHAGARPAVARRRPRASMGELPADLQRQAEHRPLGDSARPRRDRRVAAVYEFARRRSPSKGARSSAARNAAPRRPDAVPRCAGSPPPHAVHARARQRQRRRAAAPAAMPVPAQSASLPVTAPPGRDRRHARARVPRHLVDRGQDATADGRAVDHGYPGATHAVGGAPPFEVVLGNAERGHRRRARHAVRYLGRTSSRTWPSPCLTTCTALSVVPPRWLPHCRRCAA